MSTILRQRPSVNLFKPWLSFSQTIYNFRESKMIYATYLSFFCFGPKWKFFSVATAKAASIFSAIWSLKFALAPWGLRYALKSFVGCVLARWQERCVWACRMQSQSARDLKLGCRPMLSEWASLHVGWLRYHFTCKWPDINLHWTLRLSQKNSPHHIALPPILTYAAMGGSPMPRQDTYENAPQSTMSTHFFKPENCSFYHFHETLILILC